MLLTDYLADFLVSKGIKKAFGITGSAVAPVFDSFHHNKKIELICVQHEQAAAMAADAYSRTSGNFGVAISTSGPGATNMITGIGCAWFDHIPTLFISGQVNSKFTKGNLPIKQVGFQETDVVSIVKPITKYAVMVKDPKMIRYELEKALHIALSGRPGPVLIDLPMDLQKANIKLNELAPFKPKPEHKVKLESKSSINKKIKSYIKDLRKAKRPVILVGGGVINAKAVKEMKTLVEKLKLPTVLTWVAIDSMHDKYPYYIGRIGTYGQRAANFTFQNSDLLLSLGSRHDGRQTGGRVDSFARAAKRYVVDIDKDELKHQQVKCHVNINADLKDFLTILNKKLKKEKGLPKFTEWLSIAKKWKQKYQVVTNAMRKPTGPMSGYAFMEVLSQVMSPNDVLVGDCGGNIVQLSQAFKIKKGQRIVTSWAHSPMGYAFAASMGAFYGKQKQHKTVVCTVGDGGMQVNMQELQTFKYYNIPVKVLIMNNHSYGIIKQYQDTYFNSRYIDAEGLGYGVPDFKAVAKAYGLKTAHIKNYKELKTKLKKVLKTKGPVICNVEITRKTVLEPKVMSWSTGLEDQQPFLPRKEFYSNLFIEPLDGKAAADKNLP